MEELALNVAVATPGPWGMNAGYRELKNALFRAQNDYMLDNVVDPDQGLYAAIALPTWDPAAATREVERVGDQAGFVAAQTFYGSNAQLGHHEFDPLLEQLVAHDLPVLQHGHEHDHDFEGSRQTYMEAVVNDWPYYAQVSAANMIFNGVFERFPEIDVVLQEAGQTWVHNFAYRADEMYQCIPGEMFMSPRHYEDDRESLDKMPSEHFFDNFHLTTQPVTMGPRSETDTWLAASNADEMLMFSTDFPHITLDTMNWLVNRDIPDQTVDRILHGNALEVFSGISV
jgi:predicted TIM-barrel fold metal-dependent hydrolase